MRPHAVHFDLNQETKMLQASFCHLPQASMLWEDESDVFYFERYTTIMLHVVSLSPLSRLVKTSNQMLSHISPHLALSCEHDEHVSGRRSILCFPDPGTECSNLWSKHGLQADSDVTFVTTAKIADFGLADPHNSRWVKTSLWYAGWHVVTCCDNMTSCSAGWLRWAPLEVHWTVHWTVCATWPVTLRVPATRLEFTAWPWHQVRLRSRAISSRCSTVSSCKILQVKSDSGKMVKGDSYLTSCWCTLVY